MKIAIAMILSFLILSCETTKESDETEIMYTICIDGAKHLSVMNGVDCYYHPIEIDGKLVECNETSNDQMQPLRVR